MAASSLGSGARAAARSSLWTLWCLTSGASVAAILARRRAAPAGRCYAAAMGPPASRTEAAVEPRLALAPLRAAVLVGGASRRMGRPKEALRVGGERLLDRILAALEAAGGGAAVLLGAGRTVDGRAAALRRIPDAPG